MQQVVTEPTRVDPATGKESLIDPIITTMSAFYKKPKCLDPLQADQNKRGKDSDHKIAVFEPIENQNDSSARIKRIIKLRPITKKGLDKMLEWLMEEKWLMVFNEISAHKKAENFQKNNGSACH